MTKRKAGGSSSTPVTPMTTRASAAAAARATRSATRSGKAKLRTPRVEDKSKSSASKPKSSASKYKSSGGASPSGVAGVSYSDNRPRLIARPYVIIEHCVDAIEFKKKAEEVERKLKKANIGIGVTLNPQAVVPRHSRFEISLVMGFEVEVFVGMFVSSPFAALKALDVNKVVTDIVERAQAYRAEQYMQ